MRPRAPVAALLLAAIAAPAGCRRDEVQQHAAALRVPPDAADLDPAAGVVQVRLRASALSTPRGHFRYAYDGENPGPTIRAKVGDTIEVRLDNALADATTIHWHGMKVPWEMDGVTWMRDPVMPGEGFTYRFRAERAGTFWYHPHFDTESQVDGGMYGLVVVEDPAEPRVDEELALIFDAGAEHVEAAHGSGGSAGGHAKIATTWLVNGQSRPIHRARGGTTLRARLLNASNAGYLALRWPGIRQIGSDQGLLPELARPERLLLAPGDRADVEIPIGGEAISFLAEPYSLNGGDSVGDPREVLRIEVDSPAAAPEGKSWPFAPAAPSADPGHADIVYALAGSDRTGTWLINGERFPNVTIEALPLGRRAVIEVRNLSPTEHPFHLHGLSFEVLSLNGTPPPHRTVEDTINLAIRDRVRLLVDADNPGDWMAHCHILPHAHEGMMTVLRVTE